MIKVTKCPQPLLLFNDNVPEKLAITVSKSPPTKSDKNNFKIPPPPVLRPTQKHSVFEYIDAHASSKIGQRSERMSEVAKRLMPTANLRKFRELRRQLVTKTSH